MGAVTFVGGHREISPVSAVLYDSGEQRMLLPESFRISPTDAATTIMAAAEQVGLETRAVPVEPGERWPERPSFGQDLNRLNGIVGPTSEVGSPITLQAGSLTKNLLGTRLGGVAVAKLEDSSRGEHKHLLNDEDRLSTFMDWLDDHPEQGTEWLVQERIDSPVGDRPVSIRVLADCRGDIVGSQLLHGIPFDYSPGKLAKLQRAQRKGQPKDENPIWELTKPKSPYYLKPLPVASNQAILKGEQRWIDRTSSYTTSASLIGGSAVLDPQPNSHPYSKLERRLLGELDLLDEDGQGRLPLRLARNAAAIARQLGRKGRGPNAVIQALYLGIDYVPAKNGRYYFLEANRQPSMGVVRDLFGGVESVPEGDAFSWLVKGITSKLARAGEKKPILVAQGPQLTQE